MKSTPSLTSQQIVIESSRGWLNLKLINVWKYRELLYFLIWRDVKVRYKQTALGAIWIIFQPIISMLVYSGLFGVLLQVPTNGIPYPLFVLSGLLPWQYFASSLSRSSTSLVDSSNLITKVYFPRLVIPISAVLSGLVDLFISCMVLVVLLFYYQIPAKLEWFYLFLLFLQAVLIALGFGLWLTAVNVRYRDVKQLLPFIIQIWMYLTPVVYSVGLIPERFRWLLSINPMTAVVIGIRWALFGSRYEQSYSLVSLFLISFGITFLVLFTGLVYFKRTERTFSDII